MWHRTICGIAVLSAAIAMGAEGPRLVGPDKLEPGDLGIFKVEGLATGTNGAWKVWPKAAEAKCLPVLLPGGRTALVFASREPVTLLVIYAYPTAGGAEVLLHECRNSSDGPNPGPNPNPGPSPPGPSPPGPADAWRDWARAKASELVQSPSRATEAQALARALRSIAQAAAAGGFSSPRQAREALRAASRQALGESTQRWMAFSDAVDRQMDELAARGQLTHLSQYAELWQAMASGLELVQ